MLCHVMFIEHMFMSRYIYTSNKQFVTHIFMFRYIYTSDKQFVTHTLMSRVTPETYSFLSRLKETYFFYF